MEININKEYLQGVVMIEIELEKICWGKLWICQSQRSEKDARSDMWP